MIIQGVSRRASLGSVATWGPAFKISFDVYIDSYNGHNLRYGAWAELMRFTTTQHDCCNNRNAYEGRHASDVMQYWEKAPSSTVS